MRRAEFERQALEHLESVHRFARHLCRRADEAEDIVQEVYVKAFRPRVIRSFRPELGGMRAWLLRIARNCVLARAERDRRRRALHGALAAESPRPESSPEAPAGAGLADFDWERVDERLKSAIDELSDEHREILLLWGVEGLKYREIADILEVPLGTVMSRLHRARAEVTARLLRDPQAISQLGLKLQGGRVATGGTP